MLRNRETADRIAAELARAGYVFRAAEMTGDDLRTQGQLYDTLSLLTLWGSLQLLTAGKVKTLDERFDAKQLDVALSELRSFCCVAGYKLIFGSSAIVAAYDADGRSAAELLGASIRLEHVTVDVRAATGNSGELTIRSRSVGGLSAGIFAILMYVFQDSDEASSFEQDVQRDCKIAHVATKRYVLPWVVDVSRRRVSSHRGLPFVGTQLIDRARLQREIFQAAP